MNRTEELMNKKGAELIAIADSYGVKCGANKERTQLKEAKKVIVERIMNYEAELAAKAAEEAAKTAQKADNKKSVKMTDEEKKAKRKAKYEERKAKRAEAMEGRDPKTECFEFNGKSQTLTEWSKELGIKRLKLYRRIYFYGWTIEKAFEAEA